MSDADAPQKVQRRPSTAVNAAIERGRVHLKPRPGTFVTLALALWVLIGRERMIDLQRKAAPGRHTGGGA